MSRSAGTDAPAKPLIVTDRDTLAAVLAKVRSDGQTIGLVPTMGALHDGHLSLVRRAVRECDFTVVTIFVNPTQFGPQEDFARYPRTLEADLQALAQAQADLVYAPTAEQIYRPGFSTFVDPPDVAQPLEGHCRPGHFRGVATIVLKLFHLVPAHVAYFGRKDYQQWRVIQAMAEDLDLPIRVEACPTVREPDGLAMSSRNRYLTPAERQQAVAVSRCLLHAAQLAAQGETRAAMMRQQMRDVLTRSGITRIDYVALVDPLTLTEVEEVHADTVALVAAFVGGTRLIDNRQLKE
ncbi:MAG: pantoate--beta-alanine ligase [Pirellulaceae bacterium]|jgi:pantoate--beta-alanine ligase|nr:pantoate--beta-alanine ligase [Pirellulaceae bacterium]